MARGVLSVVAASAANQEALYLSGGELFVDYYNDEEFVSNRASISFSGETNFEGAVTRIDIDGAETVGDASYCFKTGSGAVADKIYVYDVDGAVVHEYEIPATKRATTPLLRDGWLYWLEWPIAFAGTVSVLLKKSRCDLSTGLATVHTFSLDEKNGNAGGAQVPLIVPLDGDVWFLWKMNNEDGEQWYRAFSKDLSTGAAANVTADVLTTQFGATMTGDDWAEVDPNIGQSDFSAGCAVYFPAEGKAYVAWQPSSSWPGPGDDPWPALWTMDSPVAMVSVWDGSDAANFSSFVAITRRGTKAQIQGSRGDFDVFRHPVPAEGAFPEAEFTSGGSFLFWIG